jgi:hypothetical protein
VRPTRRRTEVRQNLSLPYAPAKTCARRHCRGDTTRRQVIHATLLAQQFALNHQVAHANLSGVTYEESLVQANPAGNCLNRVLGHVVTTRNLVLDALGEPRIWNAGDAGPYQRGARLPLSSSHAMPLAEILAAFDRSQETISC